MRPRLNPARLTVRRAPIQWLILHHTAELYPAPSAQVDNAQFQLPALYNNALEKDDVDLNYHFVIEMIKDDYYVMTTRPFVYLCDWDDIDPNINKRSIHAALLGSYDFKIPAPRLLEVLSFRLINPLIKMFNITPNRVKLHRDVSNDKDLTCPGDFVSMDKVISLTRKYVIK